MRVAQGCLLFNLFEIFIKQYNLIKSDIHISRKSKPLILYSVCKIQNHYKWLIKLKYDPCPQGPLIYFFKFILNKK